MRKFSLPVALGRPGMLKKSILLLIILIYIASASGLTACGTNGPVNMNGNGITNTGTKGEKTGEAGAQKTIIGLSVNSLTDNFIKMIADGLVEKFKAEGVEVIVASNEMQQDKQIEQMENFAAMGAKLIISFPIVTEALESTVKSLRGCGIKVFFIGAEPQYMVDGYKLVDQAKVGTYAAEMAIKWLDSKYPAAEPGSIPVAVFTSSNISDLKIRSEAMVNTIAADPRVKIVFKKDNVMENTQGIEGMYEALALNHDIKLVLCIADAVAIGVNTVLMGEKSLNHDEIAIFASTFSEAGQELVKKSQTNESVLRGLIMYGSGDTVDTIINDVKKVLNNEVEPPLVDLDPISSFNNVGYHPPE